MIKSTPFSLTLRHFRWHWGVQNTNYDIETNAICNVSVRFYPNNIESSIKYQKQYTIFFKYEIYQVPWNSMELQKRSVEFHWILWNSVVWKKFHGNPWNYGSGQNSMECHGIPWNLRFCCSSSMEFHGTTGVVQMLLKKFHGNVEKVPWNFLIKISFNEHWKKILNDILVRN